MPNLCVNELFIGYDGAVDDELSTFHDAVRDENAQTELSLARLCPCPPELLRMEAPCDKETAQQNIEKFGYPDWYAWRLANWGTKWDVEAKLIPQDEWCLAYRFYSAWAPPIAWLRTASDRFPHLFMRLQYGEPTSGFWGVAIAPVRSRTGVLDTGT